jgi:hypothetical protein
MNQKPSEGYQSELQANLRKVLNLTDLAKVIKNELIKRFHCLQAC